MKVIYNPRPLGSWAGRAAPDRRASPATPTGIIVVITTSGITMQFGGKPLFENVSIKFGQGNR
ncbi:MAG: hypothetical protein AAB115_06665, partial [Pseudomonadota bacterium]